MDMEDIWSHDFCLKVGVMTMFIDQLGEADENTQQEIWHPKYGQVEKKSRAK